MSLWAAEDIKQIKAQIRQKEFQQRLQNLGSEVEDVRTQAVHEIIANYRDMVDNNIAPLTKSKNRFERLSAVQILSAFPQENYKTIMLELAQKEKDKPVRQAAYNALRSYKTLDVQEKMLNLFPNCTTAEKEIIIAALSEAKFEPALKLLEESLNSKEATVRIAAIGALVEFKRPTDMDIFIRAYDDPEANVRYAAVRALHIYDIKSSPKIIAFLKKAEKDENHRVRRVATKMLQFGHKMH